MDKTALLIAVSFFLLVGVGAIWLKQTECSARWDGVRKSEWSIFSGCRVESRGKMIPETRIWYERND